MIDILIIVGVTFIACWILVPIVLGFARLFGLYTIIQEKECVVYTTIPQG